MANMEKVEAAGDENDFFIIYSSLLSNGGEVLEFDDFFEMRHFFL